MASRSVKKSIYKQGLANLKLEGIKLSLRQHRIVRQFQAGIISRAELIEKAKAYARSR